MNYIELINRYWQIMESETERRTSVETEIYFRLLDYCNKLHWRNPFTLPNPRALALMAITKNTLAAGREKLVSKGLIGFRNGSRRKAEPVYCFPVKIDDEWIFPDGFGSTDDPKTDRKDRFGATDDPKSRFGSIIDPKIDPKTDPKTRGINKYNNINKKQKTSFSPNGDGIAATQTELKFPKEKSPKKPKSNEAFIPPTLDEVLQYFLSQDADKRLEDWEFSARLFFNSYDAVEWRNKFGHKISRWDSVANNWILYRERDEKENRKKNEQSQTDRPDSPRGGIPIKGRVVPSGRLKRRDTSGEV